MANESDGLLLFDEDPVLDEPDTENIPAWNILIADDDTAIHSVTKLVLSDVLFEGRPLNFLSAYSGKQTREILSHDTEIAIILLDVVMETPHSGLEIVQFLREELHNHRTRIILRTGQPGEAPERAIITEYDINDYKEKADLTSQRLFSCVLSALRSYRDIITIEQSKRGLEQIIEASNLIFRANNSLSNFAKAVLDQISALLQSDTSFICIRNIQNSALNPADAFEIISGTPAFSNFLHKPIATLSNERILAMVAQSIAEKKSQCSANEYLGYFSSSYGFESVLYLGSKVDFTALDRQILNLFSRHITQAFENITLNKEIMDTHKELVFTIGDIIESHQTPVTGHVQRTTEFCLHLAKLLGLSDEDCELLSNAIPLHDMGMIMVPEHIITKTASLTQSEIELMQHHTTIGGKLLAMSHRTAIRIAARVAAEHHEQWSGNGYPAKLRGEEIHPFARMCHLADAFDAMAHVRPWRNPLSTAEIQQHISDGRGIHFDPNLVDIVLGNFSSFMALVTEPQH